MCDDEPIFRKQVRDSIATCELLPKGQDISLFATGADLIECHSKHPFDIIFLDIHMERISGLEAGKMIRDFDRDVIVIFVTSHEQHTFESFKIEIFDYLMKPVSDEDIFDVLRRALMKYKERHHIIEVSQKDTLTKVDVSDIIYIEGHGNRIKLVTKDGEPASYCLGSLSDYNIRLSQYGFIRCHQNCLINMNYIKRIEKSSIITVYGQEVKMSVRKRQCCIDAFSDFLTKYLV